MGGVGVVGWLEHGGWGLVHVRWERISSDRARVCGDWGCVCRDGMRPKRVSGFERRSTEYIFKLTIARRLVTILLPFRSSGIVRRKIG